MLVNLNWRVVISLVLTHLYIKFVVCKYASESNLGFLIFCIFDHMTFLLQITAHIILFCQIMISLEYVFAAVFHATYLFRIVSGKRQDYSRAC